MPAKSSLPEDREPGVRVILMGGVKVESFGDDPLMEVHRCDDVSQFARFWEEAGTAVVLVDLERLSDGDRASLRKQMVQLKAVHVLAIADSIDDNACEKLLRMGCVGSLQRREASATIKRAVRAVTAGELWFPRATLSRVLRGFLTAQDPDRLTTREVEILALVGEELNNQQIADKLYISRETVRWHIKSLHSKLGTRTRPGLGEHFRLMNRLGRAIPAHRESGNGSQSLAS